MSWREGTGPTAVYVTIRIISPRHSFNYCRFGWGTGENRWLKTVVIIIIIIIIQYYRDINILLYKRHSASRPRAHHQQPASELVACQLQCDGWFSRDVTPGERWRITDPENVPRGIFVQPLNAFKRNYFVFASLKQWELRFADTLKLFEHHPWDGYNIVLWRFLVATIYLRGGEGSS